MCCFSKPVKSVTDTNIFVRADDAGREFLAYSMSFEAKEDLAIILPLPVPENPAENAVEFINLKDYPDFFADLHRGFPTKTDSETRGGMISAAAGALPELAVVPVGDFEASFVPAVKDFSRLDARFRLPADTWQKLPQYRTYGFAVFKLKPGAMRVHPMAFSFPRRNPGELFFPTVHIHDGKVHARARFDHVLYCQPHNYDYPNFSGKWEESHRPAKSFMDLAKAKGLVEADQHCYKRELHGQLVNRDTMLTVG